MAWSRLLGVEVLATAATVVAAVIVGIWSLTAAALPGKEVGPSIAGTLRGGDCFATNSTAKCSYNATNAYCDPFNQQLCKKVDKYYNVTGTNTPRYKLDPLSNVCCGASSTTCMQVNTKIERCGTTGITSTGIGVGGIPK
jgi:hypothetical protein